MDHFLSLLRRIQRGPNYMHLSFSPFGICHFQQFFEEEGTSVTQPREAIS